MFEGLFRGEHLVIILVIVILVFPNKLAGLGGSLGKSIRDFKRAMTEPGPGEAAPSEAKSLPPEKK